MIPTIFIPAASLFGGKIGVTEALAVGYCVAVDVTCCVEVLTVTESLDVAEWRVDEVDALNSEVLPRMELSSPKRLLEISLWTETVGNCLAISRCLFSRSRAH